MYNHTYVCMHRIVFEGKGIYVYICTVAGAFQSSAHMMCWWALICVDSQECLTGLTVLLNSVGASQDYIH